MRLSSVEAVARSPLAISGMSMSPGPPDMYPMGPLPGSAGDSASAAWAGGFGGAAFPMPPHGVRQVNICRIADMKICVDSFSSGSG